MLNYNERSAGFVATLSSAKSTIGDIVECTQDRASLASPWLVGGDGVEAVHGLRQGREARTCICTHVHTYANAWS
jgi:hypothetical protein